MVAQAEVKKLEGSGVAPLMTSLVWLPPPRLQNMPRMLRLQLGTPDSGEGLLVKIFMSAGGASPSADSLRLFGGVS
jgi:hypothetical protein